MSETTVREGAAREPENKMGVMPVNRLLISMSVPMVVAMLVQALYNVVDSMFVARLNENALTAVSLAFPAQNLMIAVATGTGVGVNAILSRSLGEKNFKKANRVANHGVFLALMSYIVFAVLGLLLSRRFFLMQTDIEEIVNYGADYLFICTVFSFGIFGQIAFERLLQSTGKTLFTMFTQGTGAIINIIMDPILIFGLCGFPKMGVCLLYTSLLVFFLQLFTKGRAAGALPSLLILEFIRRSHEMIHVVVGLDLRVGDGERRNQPRAVHGGAGLDLSLIHI